jgi:hypothetical protein
MMPGNMALLSVAPVPADLKTKKVYPRVAN